MTLISTTQPRPQPLIGVDVGGTTLKFGLVDAPSCDILHQFALPTDAEHGVDAVIARIAEGVNQLLGEYPHPIPAIGMGIPGVVNQQGNVCYPPNFPGWEVVPVAKRLAPLLARQLPIAVENDANVAAIAEAQAPGRNRPRFPVRDAGHRGGGAALSPT
ncbi:MAG: glucokinase, partial [Chlorobi bacterium OLB7]